MIPSKYEINYGAIQSFIFPICFFFERKRATTIAVAIVGRAITIRNKEKKP